MKQRRRSLKPPRLRPRRFVRSISLARNSLQPRFPPALDHIRAGALLTRSTLGVLPAPALPTGHLTRCCKHTCGAYAQLEPSGGWPGWLGAFLRLSWTPHPKQKWLVLQIRPAWFVLQARSALVLISSAPNGWADVFASKDGCYDRYGYNVVEDRWDMTYNRQTAREL